MKVKDKNLNVEVDVCESDCPNRPCYWARIYPGNFVQGKGYKNTTARNDYICGTREIRGCPDEYCD